jgi:hypothetical protein
MAGKVLRSSLELSFVKKHRRLTAGAFYITEELRRRRPRDGLSVIVAQCAKEVNFPHPHLCKSVGRRIG